MIGLLKDFYYENDWLVMHIDGGFYASNEGYGLTTNKRDAWKFDYWYEARRLAIIMSDGGDGKFIWIKYKEAK